MTKVSARAVWVSEHYWPGVADELVFAQAQRLAGVPGWLGAIVLSGQETVIGLYTCENAADVEAGLAAVGLRGVSVGPGWAMSPARVAGTPPDECHLHTLETS